jgi:hypothetical protein
MLRHKKARSSLLRALSVVGLLLISSVVVTSAGPVPPDGGSPSVPIAEAPDTATAMAAARRQGSRVGIADLTAESKLVYAEPDGTLTARLATRPIRAKEDDAWVEIDTKLRQHPDGTLHTGATTADVAFSAGGADTPLARIATEDKIFALMWPGDLPPAVVTDDTATYSEVFPGVDLEMRAEADGYNQRLIIKTAEAAKNPGLAQIRFGLTADGVTLRTTASGQIEAVDASGGVVFVAPAPMMWDDRGIEVSHTPVGVSIDTGNLTLVPDQKMLADPTTRFPVVVDPDFRTVGQSTWAKVFTGHPNDSYVNGTNDGDAWGKVGYCGWSDCNGIGTARTYYQYDTSFLADKRLISAFFDTTIVHGPSCTASDQQLYVSHASIGWGTTWNNAPSGTLLGTKSAPGSCDGYQPLGFSVGNNLNKDGLSTYFMKAPDNNENNKYSWRRYDVTVTWLAINYNSRPNPPYEMKTDPPLPAPCRWCGGVPYLGDNFVRLQSKLSDPDSNEQLRPIWDIYGGPSVEHRDSGPNQISGANFSTDVDLRSRHAQLMSWTAYAADGYDAGDWRNGPGPFMVDQIGVDRAPNVSGVLYREDNLWHGGVGVPDTFTFDANGVDDIDHYLYGWNDPPTTPVDADALGGKASVKLAPPGDGPRDLFVQSVDRAGHPSPARVYHFYVRAGNGALAQWSLDGNTKDTAILGFRDATLHGNATYTPGATDSAIRLDGTTAYVTAPSPMRTDTSFSASAWVNLAEKKTGWSTVLSQNAGSGAMVKLGYTGSGTDKWAVELRSADNAQATTVTVSSTDKAQSGAWTHLAAVYDETARQIRLYVNGDLSGAAAWTTPWNAVGEFDLGRALRPGTWSDYLSGSIDEVRAYDRVLSGTEIKTAVSRDNVAAGYWKLDETDGKTARNVAAGGDMAVLQGGAVFSSSGAVNGAVTFNGTTGFAVTGTPAVLTSQSFAVSAWVKPDKIADMTALSQDGTNASGFYLKQQGGAWIFGMHQADLTNGTLAAEATTAANSVQVNVWTHLTGVYNAAAKTVTLFVNGLQVASVTAPVTPWNAAGVFAIGRGKYGTNVSFWSGSIDEVRAYSRVLAAAEVQGIVSQNNVTAGWWTLDGDAKDASGRGIDGTLIGAPQWASGQTTYPDPADLAVSLNGSTHFVRTPVVTDTSKSFSVSTWAKLTSKTVNSAALVSQNGIFGAAFTLGYSGSAEDRWLFTMTGSDTTTPTSTVTVPSPGSAQIGVWTHLAAVYDAAAGTMTLFVNGTPSSTATFNGGWNATGELDIGRAKTSGNWGSYAPASVDDVKVYSRPLFADEVRTSSGRDLALTHNWQFEESSGTNVADAVGTRNGTFNTGASFAPGRVGNAVSLDGAHGSVSTTGIDLRTDQSFTVSTWVYLDRKSDIVSKFAALSQDGTHTSKFRLGHVADEMNSFCFDGSSDNPNACGAWTFEMTEADTDAAPVSKAAVSTLPAEINTWTHLVGVYDQQTKKTWLYVNGSRVGDGTLNTPWPSSGGVQIGRAMTAGNPAQYWPGKADDVRIYTGVLDKERILSLYKSYPALDTRPATLPVADKGHWTFDERTGTTASDSSGRGLTATMKGGATWTDGRIAPAVLFDGASGYADTLGPVVDTAQSFSVAAWVNLTKADTVNRTMIAQDGVNTSAFQLQYNGSYGKWAVVVPTTDEVNPGGNVTILLSTQPASIYEYSHLAMVYDASLRQLKLYVNGELSGARVGVTLWGSTGQFSTGRGRWNGGNAGYFAGAIDDVRAYGSALSDGQVRKVYDDAPPRDGGTWRFDDGTAKDYSFRNNGGTLTGGTSLVPGVSGKALKVNGTTGHMVVPGFGSTLLMSGSFTVSTWAKLSARDHVATVVAQDGGRMSGFALQYRPEKDRWVFGAAQQDRDSSPTDYTASRQPPELNQWTYLTGVYDYSGRQLRLYVDGQLASTRNGVTLWRATGALSVGRGKYNGAAAEFFPGAIDDVHTSLGVTPDDVILRNASYPAAVSGQLGRYVNAAGDRRTASTSAVVPQGYHFEESFGILISGAQVNTRKLYTCRFGTDEFTSLDSSCEGQPKVGEAGQVYTTPPANLPTVPIYRCKTAVDHFESRQADCEGAIGEGLLGYSPAYAPLARYNAAILPDHLTTGSGGFPGYYLEGAHGFVPLVPQTGTRPLMSCLNDMDYFVSPDVACEGKTIVTTVGQLWDEPPPEQESQPLYRCLLGADSFTSTSTICEGGTVDRLLGYLLTDLPATAPLF